MDQPIIGWIDSFVMATAMALAGCPRTYRRQVIVGFMIFDFLGSLAGLSLDAGRALIVVSAFALSFVAIYAGRKRPAFYALVPILCATDNLFSGPSQAGSAVVDGVASGVVACAGFWLGAFLQKRFKGAAA